MIGNLYHVYGEFKPEVLCGKRQGCSPLSGSGFGGDVGHSLFFAIVSLRDCRIELVGSYGAHAFVFEIDVSRGVEEFFKAAGSYQRSGAPDAVHFAHFVGDFNPAVGFVKLLTRSLL